jgi:arginyl-tRNA synthetase
MSAAYVAPQAELERRIREATRKAFGPEQASVDPQLKRSDRADFQANLAMSLGKALKRPPREVAQALLAELAVGDLCERVEVAGPGFINLTLKNSVLDRALCAAHSDPRLGVGTTLAPDTVVLDYGGPNVAKEMHVGHLRSNIIGDCLARVLEFAGHRVIRQNHLGDWGTPFGMLIEHLIDAGGVERAAELSVGDLDAFYKAARSKFDADEGFAERARQRVVLLQSGDEATLAWWRALVDASTAHFQKVFERLGVTLTPADIRGESCYNAVLPEIARDLQERGIAVEEGGALCVFVPGFRNRDGAPLPLIVRKNDGGFGYAATDLAALRFRVRELGGTRMLYVVGAPQAQHFAMVFAAARLAGYVPDRARTEHVGFGSILGEDRKMFRTRSGESLRLSALLDEGEERAAAALAERGADLPPELAQRLAASISLGAIKYADLSSDRIKDYVFDWQRMLAFEGNTGPYLQYAHARIRSIFRKLDACEQIDEASMRIEHDCERALALALLGFEGAVQSVEASLEPHRLCGYLHDLASAFSAFYVACPVLQAESPEQRASRLILSELTARVLARGLDLLGIEAPERM